MVNDKENDCLFVYVMSINTWYSEVFKFKIFYIKTQGVWKMQFLREGVKT